MVNTIRGPASYQTKIKDGVIKTVPESSNISPTMLAWPDFFPQNPNQLPSFYSQYPSEDHTQVKQEILRAPDLFHPSKEPTPRHDIFQPSPEPPPQSYFYQPSKELPHQSEMFQPSTEPLPQPDFFLPSQDPPFPSTLFQPNPQHEVYQPSHRERPLQPDLLQTSRNGQLPSSHFYQSPHGVQYSYPPYPPQPQYYPYQPPGYFPDPYGYGSSVLADPMAIFYGDWQQPSEKIEPQEESQLLAEIQNVKSIPIVKGDIIKNVANLPKVKIEKKPQHVYSVTSNEYKPTVKVESVVHEIRDSVGSIENVSQFSKPTSTNVTVIKHVDPVEAKYSGQSAIEPNSTDKSKIDLGLSVVDSFEPMLMEDFNTDTNVKDAFQEERKLALLPTPCNPESVYSECFYEDPSLPGKRNAPKLGERKDDVTIPGGGEKMANISKSAGQVKFLHLGPDEQEMISAFYNMNNQDIIDKVTSMDSSQTVMKAEIENLNASEKGTVHNIELNNEVKVESNTSEQKNQKPVTSKDTIMALDQTEIPKYSGEERDSVQNIDHISSSLLDETQEAPIDCLNNTSGEASTRNLSVTKTSRKRKAIKLEEWEDDDTLPEGWKKKTNISKSSGKILKTLFLFPDQQKIFSSRKEIVTYMTNSNMYNQDIIDKVTFGGKRRPKISPKSDRPLKKIKLSNVTVDSSQTDMKSTAENLNANVEDSEQNLGENGEVTFERNTSECEAEKSVTSKEIMASTNDFDPDVSSSLDETIISKYSGEEDSMLNSEHINNEEIYLKSNTDESKTEANAPPTDGLDVENLTPVLDLSKAPKSQSPPKSKTPPKNKTPPAWTDWEFDESLPKDWKVRSQQKTFLSKGESKIRIYHQYLSPNGQTFASKPQLITHMKESQIYSQEEIMAVKKGKAKASPAKEVKINVSNDMARENERTPTKADTKSSDDKDGWKTDDEILPEGWRKRIYTGSNNAPVIQYMSSNRKVLNSEKEVFSFMKSSSIYSLDDVIKFLSGVKRQENGEGECEVSPVENVQYQFECEYCPQQFPSSTKKSWHREVEHKGQFRYKCNECGLGDLKKSSLQYHVQSNHSVHVADSPVTFNLQVPEKIRTTNLKRTAPECEISSANKRIKKVARQGNQSKAKFATKDNEALMNPDKEGNDISDTSDQYDGLNEPGIVSSSVDLSDRLVLEQNETKLTVDCNEEVGSANLKNWIADETLPVGWKRSLVGHDNFRKGDTNVVVSIYQYLSPEGRLFYSRKEAVEHIDIYTHIKDQITTLAFEIENEQHKEREKFDNHEGQTIDESDLEMESRSSLVNSEHDQASFEGQNCAFSEQDVNENSVQENLNIKDLDYFSIPVGPLVTLTATNFEILSAKFVECPNPSVSEMEDICGGISMDVKDVKWIFIKLKHKFKLKKRKEVDKDGVQQMVNMVKDKYHSKDYFII